MLHYTGILPNMVVLSLELSETVLCNLDRPLFFNTFQGNLTSFE